MGAEGTIGARFKREREKRNFSVEDVHLRLRIHPSVIQKLEADQWKDWPGGKIYARGFLKQYSDFLGLNTADVLSEFDTLGISERPVELFVGLERKPEASEGHGAAAARSSVAKPRPEKKRETGSGSGSSLGSSSAGAGAGSGASSRAAGKAQAQAQASKKPDLIQSLPPSGQSPKQGILKWVIAAVAIAAVFFIASWFAKQVQNWVAQKPSLKLAVMAPVEKKAEADRLKARGAAANAGKTGSASAAGAAGKSGAANVSGVGSGTYLNSPAQGTFPKIRPQDRILLEVNAITDVWMRIQSDGSVVFESILKRGETERWLADKAFEVKLGRPEGVKVAVNGYPVGQPGAGKVKNLRVTRDGIEEGKG